MHLRENLEYANIRKLLRGDTLGDLTKGGDESVLRMKGISPNNPLALKGKTGSRVSCNDILGKDLDFHKLHSVVEVTGAGRFHRPVCWVNIVGAWAWLLSKLDRFCPEDIVIVHSRCARFEGN